MNKIKIITVLFLASLSLNAYFFVKHYGVQLGPIFSGMSDTGTIYQEDCLGEVVKSRICRIEVLEKRTDFAMVRVHYHYKKGLENSTRIVVKSNKGSHDNVVGTRSSFNLVEGDNTIDIPFGMYRPGSHTEDAPYRSDYIMVKAQGITADSKRYTTPPIFEVYAKYEWSWFIKGEKRSW